jgi:hypothetical protein
MTRSMKSWNADDKEALIGLGHLLLVFYFSFGLLGAISDAAGPDFLRGWNPLVGFVFIVVGIPLLTWCSMRMLNSIMRPLADDSASETAARFIPINSLRAVFLSAGILMALYLYGAAMARPHGLWVAYVYSHGFAGHHGFPEESYQFLPMTALPRIGLLFTTYIGHLLALRREPRSIIWQAASHAPLLAVYALFWTHDYWFPKPAAG